jgi:hypothetical protein
MMRPCPNRFSRPRLDVPGGNAVTPYDLTFVLAICPLLYIAFLVFEWLDRR